GAGGKIQTLGDGYLEIRHLTLLEGGSAATTTPFVWTTNTVLNIHHVGFYGYPTLSGITCVQDCVIFGGTSNVVGNTTDSSFQGYGSVMRECYGNRIRRMAYLRAGANSVIVRDNVVWNGSGSNLAGGAAFEIDGGSGNCDGAIISGNVIEITGY